MAVTIQNVADKLNEKIATREAAKIVTIGYLKEIDGTVAVPRRPNYVYFQEWAQPESSPPAVVFNVAVPPIKDLPVVVSTTPTPPFKREVIGIYHDGINANLIDNIGQLNVPLHGQTHQYVSENNIGHDPVLVWQAALQLLKTSISSGVTVKTEALVYHHDQEYYFFSGAETDLTSYMPSVGLACYVLLYLDITTGAIGVTAGTTVLDSPAIPVPLPTLVTDTIPSVFVKLYNQTTISLADDIIDARAFLTLGSSGTASPPYTPNKIGDILISEDGVTFIAGQPLVDAMGEIIVDANGHLVIM